MNSTELYNKSRYWQNKKVDGSIIADYQIDQILKYLINVINDRDVNGSVVEFGCYVGEAGKYIMKCLTESNKNIQFHVYDSFEGLPPLSKHEEGMGWQPGTLNTTEDVLKANYANNNLAWPYIHKGWFSNIANSDVPDKISFAFLDGDFYDSIYDSLKLVWPKLLNGGYILVHDYQRPDLPGVEAAIKDYFASIGEYPNIFKPCDQLAVISRGAIPEFKIETKKIDVANKDLTVVTGLWNMNRVGRGFDHYINCFRDFLDIPANLFVYIPAEYEYLVWEKRNKENTFVKVYSLDDVKRLYSPFWDRTQSIRTNPSWYSQTGEDGWLKNSPQSANEWYNPVVQSKMFLVNDVTIWDPFDTKYFMWLDAGLTNTVNHAYLTSDVFVRDVTKYIDPFLFMSYGYEANKEIHGFDFESINRHAGQKVTYVCRGGLFAGTKAAINEANVLYYGLLDKTLSEGLMGTEESIFSIMAHQQPNHYRRFDIGSAGMIVNFVEPVFNGTEIKLTGNPKQIHSYNQWSGDYNKTAIYMLTFTPQKDKDDPTRMLSDDEKKKYCAQLIATIKTLPEEWMRTKHKYIVDNSPTQFDRDNIKEVCDSFGFTHLPTGDNKGINGGRQFAAEHFDSSTDCDYYVFFEDDMTVNDESFNGKVCRNNLSRYVPDLWSKIHGIASKEELDYLKLTFTEVYLDNYIQCSWYNVPQDVRTKFWPDYDKLPVTGHDMNSPRTEISRVDNFQGLLYAVGEFYYCNWPLLFSRSGNKKVFLDVKWGAPWEQTWMSYVFQEQKKGNIKAGVLLASPITHDRFMHYSGGDKGERREN